MKFGFKARIYKVGINPCVKVPLRITDQMKPSKGYIPVKGKIENHAFQQTLVPVKDAEYRLYVNGPMLKGASVGIGQTVSFMLEQDFIPKHKSYPMPKTLKKKLDDADLFKTFKKLTPSKQKEILKYLSYLKTEESLIRNCDKIIGALKNKIAGLPAAWPFRS